MLALMRGYPRQGDLVKDPASFPQKCVGNIVTSRASALGDQCQH